jgi:hypothetical protein
MRVCIGLIMLIPNNYNNRALLKSGFVAACIALRMVGAVIGHFPPALAYNLHSPPANGKQGSIPEEMSQPLLKETWTKCTPVTLLYQHKLALPAINTLFAL